MTYVTFQTLRENRIDEAGQVHRDPDRVVYAPRSIDKQEQSIPDPRRTIERHRMQGDLTLRHRFIDDPISGTKAMNRPARTQAYFTA